MIDLIREIVEMDRKAREITDEAQAEKVHSEKEIAEKREQIRNAHLQKARKRMEELEPRERAAAEQKWAVIQAKHEAFSQKMDTLYRENTDDWVHTIVCRVLGDSVTEDAQDLS